MLGVIRGYIRGHLLFWHPFGLSVTLGGSVAGRRFFRPFGAFFPLGFKNSFYYEIDTPIKF